METAHSSVKATRLEEYQPPVYLVEEVVLDVDIHDGVTTVTSRLSLKHNPASTVPAGEMRFNGEGLALRALSLDGVALDDGQYEYRDDQLIVRGLPEHCQLTSIVEIKPEKNTALDGPYRSNGMYCTQCEAEGFRRITFFPDRPDVLSRVTTTIHADRAA